MGNRDRLLNSLLNELADRLAASDADHVLVRREHLAGASDDLLATLCDSGLLTRAEPASDTICDGCERLCPMPAETMQGPGAAGTSTFVICDKRDDIGRVPVEPGRLYQWCFSMAQVASALAELLKTDQTPRSSGDGRSWSIGAVDIADQQLEVALCVHPDEAPFDVGLVMALADPADRAGGPVFALSRLLRCRGGRFQVDADATRAAVAQRHGDARIACEVVFERGDIILLNHATGARRTIATPNFASANDLAFDVLWKNPGRAYSVEELCAEARVSRIPSLNKLVENLRFSTLLRKLFFRVSQNAISFDRQVTYGQLARMGIEPTEVA